MMREKTKAKSKGKARIGDIVEITTPAGLGYVQYTYDGGTTGELVRVLPGLYDHRPSDFATLAQQKEMYFVFYIMNYAIRAGKAEIVSNQPVPGWAKDPPTMRHAAAFGDSFLKVTKWRLISAASRLTPQELIRTPLLTSLTPEQKKLSIHEIWPHIAMVRELARGWTPERAEEIDLQDAAEAEKCKSTEKTSSEPMKYYLYFPLKGNAEQAGERLKDGGYSVSVSEAPDGEQWLVLAEKSPPKTGEQMDEIRDEMETLAVQFGGEYDGWEAAIDSLGAEDVHHRVN